MRRDLAAWLRDLHERVSVTTLLVTHDRDEAMELADEIVVLKEGRVEQAGRPDELYDAPNSDWVMEFVGPVTRIGESLARPHDLEILHEPEEGARQVLIERVLRLGFEVRVELVEGDGTPVRVQLSRGEAERLELVPGDIVWVRAAGQRTPVATLSGVRVSAKVDYAVRAAVQLAAAPPGTLVTAQAISDAQDIPHRFLDHILAELRHAGLLESRRGPEGGHRLARPASEITIADIIRPIDGPLASVGGRRPDQLELKGTAEPLRDVWIAVRASLREVLEEVTLADVAGADLPAAVAARAAGQDAWAPRLR